MLAARAHGRERAEHAADLLRRLADQHRGAQLAARTGPERGHVLTFAQAPRDQHERTREAVQRGERRADVRALRVVDVGDAAPLRDELTAVRQPRERAQHFERGADVRRELHGDRERGERVRFVMGAAQRKLRAAQQRLAVAREPTLAALLDDRVAARERLRNRERNGARMTRAHRGDERIVGVEHRAPLRRRAASP